MIVCHCNFITRADIEGAVREILAEDPSARLEPQFVYARLQRKGKCCGCFPQAESVIADYLTAAMKEVDGAGLAAVSPLERLIPKEGS
jgi:bacterioferritin-associated ferredoxin